MKRIILVHLALFVLLFSQCWDFPENPRNIDSIVSPISAADLNIVNFYLYGGDQFRYFQSGSLIYVLLEIENIGNFDSGAYNAVVYFYPIDGNKTDRIPLYNQKLPSLSPFGEETYRIYSTPVVVQNPPDFSGEYQEYVAEAFIDNEEIVEEFNYANNIRSLLMRIYETNSD